MTALCPCGSGTPEPDCCALYLAGTPAPTALALMRSRYTAYVRGAIDYVLSTHDPATRGSVDVAATTRWSHDTNWLGLEILATAGGAATDTTGIVEFIARGVTASEPFAQRERARFRKLDGAWVYTDGKTGNIPVTRAATPGRNEPCPCGSGQKYKRCHGA